MARTSASLVAILGILAGCANKPAKQPVRLELTSALLDRGYVRVSDDVARACHVWFGDVTLAPKFAFDDAKLSAADRDVLAQIATCVTTGPLRGERLALVGHADPRGEAEYNMALGEHRAESVRDYLARLGVDKQRLFETSRGELDAEGNAEFGWQRDRRVDIERLKP